MIKFLKEFIVFKETILKENVVNTRFILLLVSNFFNYLSINYTYTIL
jgi:hypothetical protein